MILVRFSRGVKTSHRKRPNALITDGTPNFNTAFKNEFFTVLNPRTHHVRHIRWQGDHYNNKMESMNDEVRDREKTMRGLKKVESRVTISTKSNAALINCDHSSIRVTLVTFCHFLM